MKKMLPKYWIVKSDLENKDWKKVIEYLNNKTGSVWNGSLDEHYYGFVGVSNMKGTICTGTHNIAKISNNPVVLTINEFINITEGKQKKKHYSIF